MSSSTTTDAGCMTHPVNKKSTTRNCNCVHRYFYLLPRERVGASSRARACVAGGRRIPLRRQQQFYSISILKIPTIKNTPHPCGVYIYTGGFCSHHCFVTIGWIMDFKPEMTVFFWSETNQHVRFGSNFEKAQNNIEKITSSTLKIKYAPGAQRPDSPRAALVGNAFSCPPFAGYPAV